MMDKEYVTARDQLIPRAVEAAYTAAGDRPTYIKHSKKNEAMMEAWVNKWNQVYHSTMNILARDAGLIN